MMVGRICPPGWNRVKVSENLGATAVVPVASVDTSLKSIRLYHYIEFKHSLARNINIHFILRLFKCGFCKKSLIMNAPLVS